MIYVWMAPQVNRPTQSLGFPARHVEKVKESEARSRVEKLETISDEVL